MIEQHARVVAVNGDRASLQTEGQSGCTSCAAKSGCGTGAVAQLFPARQRQLLELPIDHLSRTPLPGERVVIGIDERYLHRNTWLIYALPLIGLLGGALAGDFLVKSLLGPGETELGAILGSLFGLVTAFAWMGFRSRRTAAPDPDSIRILRIDPSATAVAIRDLGLHA